MVRITALAVIIFLTFSIVFNTSAQVKTYTTSKITSVAPEIDGFENDIAWDQVEWGGEYTQWIPTAGDAPSMQTSFKILYDDSNLYVLIRAHDDNPEKIERRLSRRDQSAGDWVEINIDSYYDKRSAFSFNLSAAGVKSDEYVTGDGDNWDENWDPIWYGKTSIDEKGWMAEMKIPLSQLRFGNKENHIWGLQLMRKFFRNDERSTWQPIERNMGGWVRFFGELHGISGIKSQKQLEIMPYVVARAESFEKEENNPYRTGNKTNLSAGVDGKIGLTSDITLDFTINPDFGQVEADPSTVNLSAFQQFFNEQRPFFIEGNNILNFELANSFAGGSFNNDNLFYSRRIGRNPQHYPETQDGEFVNQPDNTSILGAFKLTGKNKHGFSFGIMESITAEEKAEIDNKGNKREEVVEPLTNYLVLRAQQDINKGNTVVGGMFTATNRKLESPQLDFLHNNAYSGGVDFLQFFKDRTYSINARSFFSKVNGSTTAILNTQTSSERYFQRPDNYHRSIDSTLTSLAGSGGSLAIGKQKGKLRFQSGVIYRSPELELNNVGFLRNTDQINQWSWVGYNITEPFSIFRQFNVNFNQYLGWDFGGTLLYKEINVNAHARFKNFWRFGNGIFIEGENISNSDLRGGPSIRYPGGYNYFVYMGSDNRKKFNFNLNSSFYNGNEDYASSRNIRLNLRYQPTNSLQINLQPSISLRKNDLQYITTTTTSNGENYINGSIDQKTYSMSMRLTYNINPNLSIQYWGQPFNSRGDYSSFKVITDPGNDNYQNRFAIFDEQQIGFDTENNTYIIDENKDGITDYSFENPDFNFVQLRSNMVVRWEYKPGSTVFVVWTQNRTDNPLLSDNNSFNQVVDDIFNVQPQNVFLLKYTYRFIL